MIIGDTLPAAFSVVGASGEKRTLLSYKAAIDVLVVGFFSTGCEMNRLAWPALRKLNENYKDWHVSFLAVRASPQETLPDLTRLLNDNRLPWPAASLDFPTAMHRLAIAYTPEVLIFDEFGVLAIGVR